MYTMMTKKKLQAKKNRSRSIIATVLLVAGLITAYVAAIVMF